MLELIALWGFLGGLFRALAGFLEYGKPPGRNVPVILAVTGFVGIVSAFAVFYFEVSLLSLAFWKIAAVAALIGYVGADLLGSLFEILGKYGRPNSLREGGLKTEGGKSRLQTIIKTEGGKSRLQTIIRPRAKSGGKRC
jgi:hypothetical protein